MDKRQRRRLHTERGNNILSSIRRLAKTVNFKTIYKIIGSLLFLEAFLLLACIGVTYLYREEDALSFTLSALACAFFGLIMRYMGRDSDNTLSRRDTYLVVTITWVVFSVFGTLPFIIGGYINNITDALFESMSGFTTTGASIIDDVEALPHGIIFWRSLTQWIGGLGIIFFTVALLPSLIGGSVKVFAAEATGPLKTKLHPRLSTNSKWICGVYTVITLACFGCLWAAGMGLFDSMSFAMCTAPTGGFAPLNNSAGDLAPIILYILSFFCFTAGVSHALLYFSFSKLDFRRLVNNAEFRLYFLIVAMSTVFITVELIVFNGYDIEHAFRSSLFQVVQFASTTGLSSDDTSGWPHITWIVLAGCMILGGCAGSTSGGMKCFRGITVLKSIRNEFRQILHPAAVLPVKIDGTNVVPGKRLTIFAFISLYLLIVFIGSFAMIALGVDKVNAITLTLSCMANIGPTIGPEISNLSSCSALPVGVKWICMALMLLGRLEIFSVLVILTPSFWKDN